MIFLSLLWLLLGSLIGLLARAAQLQSQRYAWLVLLSAGALAALGGGWLGTFLLGRYFATALALSTAIVGIIVIPRSVSKLIFTITSGDRARTSRLSHPASSS